MRCAVYIRVSTEKEEQKASLANQRDLFIKYISDNNWDIHEFYVDVESGTTAKREELQRLIQDARDKKFDIILAKELSRLARNGELSYQIRNIAQSNKIDIITLDNAINTIKGDSNMFGLYAWMYEQESQRISERVKYALKSRAEKGLFKGSIPPYGYKLENGKLHIKADETPNIVKRIFREYLSGKGFDRIAMELYEEDIPTPAQVAGKSNAGDKWHGSSVRGILENAHYIGNLVQGRTNTISVTCKTRNKRLPTDYTVVENTHEAIISYEDFQTVQQLIKSRKKIRPQQQIHLFTNILFCEDCGHGMHFKKNRRGYVCGNYNKHGQKACSDHIVREDELSNTILTDLKYLMSNLKNEKFLATLENMINKQKKKIEKDLKACIKEIETLNSKKSKAISLLIDESITKDDYDKYVFELNEKISKLEITKYQNESTINQKFDSSIIENLKNLKDSVLDLKELTPDILNRFIERIEIKSDGTPKIHYRFSESSVYFSDFFSNTQHSTCFVIGNISTG